MAIDPAAGRNGFEDLPLLGLEVDTGTRRRSEYIYDTSNYSAAPAAVGAGAAPDLSRPI